MKIWPIAKVLCLSFSISLLGLVMLVFGGPFMTVCYQSFDNPMIPFLYGEHSGGCDLDYRSLTTFLLFSSLYLYFPSLILFLIGAYIAHRAFFRKVVVFVEFLYFYLLFSKGKSKTENQTQGTSLVNAKKIKMIQASVISAIFSLILVTILAITDSNNIGMFAVINFMFFHFFFLFFFPSHLIVVFFPLPWRQKIKRRRGGR